MRSGDMRRGMLGWSGALRLLGRLARRCMRCALLRGTLLGRGLAMLGTALLGLRPMLGRTGAVLGRPGLGVLGLGMLGLSLLGAIGTSLTTGGRTIRASLTVGCSTVRTGLTACGSPVGPGVAIRGGTVRSGSPAVFGPGSPGLVPCGGATFCRRG